MKEWTTYHLEDICKEILSGGDAAKYDCVKAKSNTYKYPVFANAIDEDGLYGYCNDYVVNVPSVTIAARGAGTGYVAYRDTPYTPIVRLISLIPKENVNPLFLYYRLKIANLRGDGSAIPQLTVPMVKKLKVTLPDYETQNTIANILRSLDVKIQLNKQINDNLEQQAQALYKSWFVDFEPFKDGEFIESELGKIPEGWQCIPFSMFVTESKAKTGKIGIKEYSVTNNGIFPRDAKYNKSLSQSSTKNKLIQYGDLVFGMSRDILNWGVMQEEQGGVSSAYTVYNINSGIVNSTYLELFIKSRIHLFSDLIRPAAREGQGIDKSVLQTKVLLYPPQKVLDTFWPLYNSVTNQIQTTTSEINRLGDIRDTLLPKLMSGEIKINEIDC